MLADKRPVSSNGLHCDGACLVTSSMGQDGSEPVCDSAGGLSQFFCCTACYVLHQPFKLLGDFTQARKLLKHVSKMTFGSLIRRLARKHMSLITIVQVVVSFWQYFVVSTCFLHIFMFPRQCDFLSALSL